MQRASGWIAIVVAVVAGSCVVGAPPGFSKGDAWTFPLVGPLENGPLVTPVFIGDKGPYLFMIDPDSPLSSVDEGIVSEVKPYSKMAERYDDEQDTSHAMRKAEISSIKIGNDLVVEHHDMWVAKVSQFNVGGRQIRGVIGHDIIADSLVFGFDRDAGLAYLATRKGFTPPPGAQTVGYRVLTSHLAIAEQPVGRRIVNASVDGSSQLLHVDLGAVPSQLREQKWGDAKLAAAPAKDVLVDEIGGVREIDHAGVAGEVAVGPVKVQGVKFVTYDDRRWEREDIDGTLGLGFFKQMGMWIDLDKQQLYLIPRADDLGPSTKARIDRWGSKVLSSCAHPACFEISSLTPEQPPAPTADASAAPGAVGAPATAAQVPNIVHIQRDPAAADLNVEIVLEAVGKDGKPRGLPPMVIEFPVGADSVTAQLDPSYGDASVRVVDASPFVRACPSAGKACLYKLE